MRALSPTSPPPSQLWLINSDFYFFFQPISFQRREIYFCFCTLYRPPSFPPSPLLLSFLRVYVLFICRSSVSTTRTRSMSRSTSAPRRRAPSAVGSPPSRSVMLCRVDKIIQSVRLTPTHHRVHYPCFFFRDRGTLSFNLYGEENYKCIAVLCLAFGRPVCSVTSFVCVASRHFRSTGPQPKGII